MLEEKKEGKTVVARIIFYLIMIGTIILHYWSVSVPLIQDKYHSFRTTETAIVIQDYFRNGLSFFNYSMPLFGKPWNVMFEFPTYQALVYGVMRLFDATNIDFCARIVSIIVFYACTFLLIRFISYITNQLNAYCVGIVFLLSAYNLYWSSAVLIDFLSVLFGMLYLLCLCICLNEDKMIAFIGGIIVGIVGYMTKGTTFFPIVIFAALYILCHELQLLFSRKERITVLFREYLKNNVKRLTHIVVLALVPAFCGLMWTKYADKLKDMSVYATWLSSNNVSEWYYGTLQQKLTAGYWLPILDRYERFFGNRWLLLAVVLVYVIFSSRKYWKIVVFSFVAQISTVFILFNLFYVHNYYLIELVPFAYLMFGTMVYEIVEIKVNFNFLKKFLTVIVFIAYIVLQFIANHDYIEGAFFITPNSYSIGDYLQSITQEDELIVVTDEDWSPVTLYDANRRGFMLRDIELLYDEEYRQFLKNDNYTTFIAHSGDGVDAISSLDEKLVQYALDSNLTMNSGVCIFKILDNNSAAEYEYQQNAYSNVLQPLEAISDGETFSIKYKSDITMGTYGHIVDKNNEVHTFLILLPANETTVKINYGLVCSEPNYVIIDGSEDLQISYVF